MNKINEKNEQQNNLKGYKLSIELFAFFSVCCSFYIMYACISLKWNKYREKKQKKNFSFLIDEDN